MATDLFEYALGKLAQARDNPTLRCKICDSDATLFDLVDFNKSCHPSLYPSGLRMIPVAYRICSRCRFVFTDFCDGFSDEQWREWIYNDEYVKVDPEYTSIRPLGNAREVFSFFGGHRKGVLALDYGAGNGLTASLMRRGGWTYDSFDPFGHTDMPDSRAGHYNFCSAFEVFEHSPDPAGSLEDIVHKMNPDNFVLYIGTAAHDGIVSERSRLAWWYAAPRNGHISLYSRESLRLLARRFDLDYHPVDILRGTHLLTRGTSKQKAIAMLLRGKVTRQLRTLARRWPAELTGAPAQP
ncbi:MAG: class I SAM-dependent methyltransferase [Polaromonas sp.]|nr:class I SAM-dependent methyltransferase [Polaromonas sp.]